MAMIPTADDPRHGLHNDILQGLSLAREELSQKETPRDAVATLPSKIVKPTRHRENTGKAAEVVPTNPSPRTWYEEDPREEADRVTAKRTRRSGYEDDPKDMRSKITQNKMDKLRKEREAEKCRKYDSTESDEDELCGLPCFTRRIRQVRKPKRFKLTAETPKYDGTQEPEAWLDDYLPIMYLAFYLAFFLVLPFFRSEHGRRFRSTRQRRRKYARRS